MSRPSLAAWGWSRLGAKAPSLLGVLAALTIAVVGNLLTARFDHRWDLTPDRRYTPSPMLQRILGGLRQDATVVVLLGRTDPLAPTIEQLLSSYRQLTPHLQIDWIDPDRDPVRFLSRQSELGLEAGHTENGQVGSDAVLVVTAGGRRHYIEAQDLVELDPDVGDSTSHFEHAIAVALNAVFDATPPTVCFTEGHRELSLTDRSPVGLFRLGERLEHDTMTVKSVDLAGGARVDMTECRLIVVAAPDVPLSEGAVRQLKQETAHASLLLLGGAVPNTEGKLVSVGLEPLASLGGISLNTAVVIEKDDAFRLPGLFGETFYATPMEHPTTRGLLRGKATSPLRVVVSLAINMQRQAGSAALPLLQSSPHSILLTDVSADQVNLATSKQHGLGSHSVAMAGTLAGTNDTLRIALLPANVLQNRAFETPSLLVTQAFGTSVVSWLVATQSNALEFSARPNRVAGAELSAGELSAIARYVGLVMPGCFLLVGLGVLFLRRKQTRGPENRRREGSDQ